jgi:predicted Rossmann-fold nucleotide-binding protein
MEVVTLVQTLKIKKALPIVLFGKEFWSKVINFETLIEFGTISPDDIDLFFQTDSVDEAVEYITTKLTEDGLPDPGPHL